MNTTTFVRIAAAATICALSVAGAMIVIDRIPGDQASTQAAQVKSETTLPSPNSAHRDQATSAKCRGAARF
jgi:hypothetical protein